MRVYRFLLVAIVLVSPGLTSAQLIKDTATLRHMEMMFSMTKDLAKNRSHQLFDVFNTQLTGDEILALKYLYAYMPLSDLADYKGDFFLANVRQVLRARQEMTWGKKVPEDIFLHFVLPLRVNNENLDSFRILMYNELKDRVKNLSMTDAALEVNHWCHEKVTYRPSDERTSSPLSTVCYSFGRCGEESTFTVAAMRTVGIPARQVYTPRWAHSDDNHAWVEVWVDGKWHFLGACEPDPFLDMGWFAGPAKRAMLVHTRAYGHYIGSEPVISNSERFSELNLIANYAPVKKFFVKVTDLNGNPLKNAKVEYQLYNYAEFYPIAKNYTGQNGISSIICGLGDLVIWANKGDSFGYKKITVENSDTVIISIKSVYPDNWSETYDLVPPVERTGQEVKGMEEYRKKNSARLKYEDSVRTVYMATFMDTARADAFAAKLELSKDSCRKVLIGSYGNWREIAGFLQNTKPAERKNALLLLTMISEKDLRDVKASVLADHLDNQVIPTTNENFYGKDFHYRYIVSPRIGNEILSPWRQFLKKNMAIPGQKGSSVPLDFKKWIYENITLDNKNNLHSRAPLTPQGVFELKAADSRSRDIFFVAVCRAFGIPARLNPETQIPEFWESNVWNTVEFEKMEQFTRPKARIHLVNQSGSTDPVYNTHFTLEYFKDGVYRTLQFEEGKPLSKFPEWIETDAGKYLLVTGNRQPDGSVLAKLNFFSLNKFSETEIPVVIREKTNPDKILGKLEIAKFNLVPFQGKKPGYYDSSFTGKPLVLVFIEPDKEPTKHVMNDLVPVKNNFEKWGGGMYFILSREKTSAVFKPENFQGLPVQSCFYWDEKDRLLGEVEKIIGKNLKNEYPLVLVLDKEGNLYYFSSGYKIGIGEQLVKKLNRKVN